MKKILLTVAALLALGGLAVSAHHETVVPAKISKDDITGKIFERPEMIESTHGRNTTLDVTTDRKSVV